VNIVCGKNECGRQAYLGSHFIFKPRSWTQDHSSILGSSQEFSKPTLSVGARHVGVGRFIQSLRTKVKITLQHLKVGLSEGARPF